MEILVCMKQVPDDSVEIHLDATGKPDLSQADPQGNAFDTYALELAVRYIEANGGTVTVATVGTEDDKVCLKNSLAVGAAKAYLISNEGLENPDASQTAKLLAAAVPAMEAENGAAFDLILCGRESTDYICGEVGEMLAEELKRPFVTNVVEVKQEGEELLVKKELDAGYQLVSAPLPAVLTISKPDYDPRYPNIKSKLAARKAKIPGIGSEQTGMAGAPCARVSFVGFLEPPVRQAGVKIQEKEPEDAVAKAMELLAAAKVL